MSNTLYFGYGTYLDDDESRNYVPNARKVTTGVAKNRKFVMCAFNGRSDRGYCHITDTVEALGSDVRGIIFEHDPKYFREYPGFERFFLTVYGDDGKMYECWSLRMIDPGVAMRPQIITGNILRTDFQNVIFLVNTSGRYMKHTNPPFHVRMLRGLNQRPRLRLKQRCK